MRKTLALLASAALKGLTLAAHADTFTYTLVGNPNLAFNFASSAIVTVNENFLTSPTISNLTCTVNGITCGYFSSASGNFFNATTGGPNGYGVQVPSFAPGNYVLTKQYGGGTFAVVDIPAVAATPEPSSLVLLGTGILGFAGAARRRFLNA